MATIDVLLNAASRKGAKVVKFLESTTRGADLPYCTILDAGTNGNQACITLPMPTQIMSMDKPLWEMKEYEMQPGIFHKLRMGVNIPNALQQIIDSKFHGQSFLGLWSNKSHSWIKENDIKDYLSHRQGILESPLREMMFKGVDFRTISLNWQLVPLSENDSKAISEAIKVLQFYSLPNVAAELSDPMGIMGYPLLWRVVFGGGVRGNGYMANQERDENDNYKKGYYYSMDGKTAGGRINKYGGQQVGKLVKSEHLPVFKDVAITNITMDYTGAGKAVFHKNNAPVQVNLSIQFSETTIHVANDVEKGFHL